MTRKKNNDPERTIILWGAPIDAIKIDNGGAQGTVDKKIAKNRKARKSDTRSGSYRRSMENRNSRKPWILFLLCLLAILYVTFR